MKKLFLFAFIIIFFQLLVMQEELAVMETVKMDMVHGRILIKLFMQVNG
jgi:hypothetical protein